MNLDNRKHALYRFYDDRGQLLYVGITLDPGPRWRQHSYEQPWWLEVATATIEKHPSRESVLQAERAAITNEHPRYNIIFNGARPLNFFDLIESPNWGSKASDMPDVCHDECRSFSRLYYPYDWENGLAGYRCVNGHYWTCKWGHHRSGSAPENAGKNQDQAVA